MEAIQRRHFEDLREGGKQGARELWPRKKPLEREAFEVGEGVENRLPVWVRLEPGGQHDRDVSNIRRNMRGAHEVGMYPVDCQVTTDPSQAPWKEVDRAEDTPPARD